MVLLWFIHRMDEVLMKKKKNEVVLLFLSHVFLSKYERLVRQTDQGQIPCRSIPLRT